MDSGGDYWKHFKRDLWTISFIYRDHIVNRRFFLYLVWPVHVHSAMAAYFLNVATSLAEPKGKHDLLSLRRVLQKLSKCFSANNY